MLRSMFSKSKQLETQRELLEKAADRIEELQGRLKVEQSRQNALAGQEQFMLSQLEGEWEVPVCWAEGPVGLKAVVVTKSRPEAPGLEPLTVMALQSAFPGRSRLEDLSESGWALVRAWPLNAPGALESLPGYRTDSYILCALTSLSLREAGEAARAVPVTPSPAAGFEARI